MHLADKPLSSMAHHCQKTLQACQQADAILLGAIGDPRGENAAYTPEKGLLDLWRALDLYANIRPIKVTDAFLPFSPLKEQIVKGTGSGTGKRIDERHLFWRKSYRQQRLRI